MQSTSLASLFEPPPPPPPPPPQRRSSITVSINGDASDEQLPAHKRRTGRMESLHEFQQRALSYHDLDAESKRSPPPLLAGFSDHFLDISTTPHSTLQDLFLDPATQPTPTHQLRVQRVGSLAASDYTDGRAGLRHRLASRRSSTSLFGNPHQTSKTRAKFYRHQAKVLAFLVLLGVIGGPLHYGLRQSYGQIAALRRYLIGLTDSPVYQYLLWAGHTVSFTMLGVVWTRLSPVASGSGISQMKSILTGIDARMYLPGYFDLSTLVAKIGGLVCAVGAGLIVGTEGAFVHIMSIVTHLLLCTRMFNGFSDRLNARTQLLAAACAVGVASTFASPIGGVLFSMEVTSTYYLISNYMKAFISSVSGAVMLQITLAVADRNSPERDGSVFQPNLSDHPYHVWELPLFTLMGALIGVIAYLMIVLLRVIALRRKKLRSSRNAWKRRFVTWIDPLLVALLVASLSYWAGEFARAKSIDDLMELFAGKELPPSWVAVSKFYSLPVLCVLYSVLLPLCITLQIPTGVWLPTFIAGAAFGRFFGEVLTSISWASSISPGAYALAGAAAFAGAATGTVSAAVITLEITATMPLMLPIFCATLASIGVCNLLPEDSVYDTLLVCSGLPYLPLVDFDPALVAGDVVEPLLVYVTKRTTIAKLLLAVQRMPTQDIPVVNNDFDMRLLGLVNSEQIRDLIRHYYQMNALPDVDVDLGDAMNTKTPPATWTDLATKLFEPRPGGFYAQHSYDHVYHALATTVQPPQQPNGVGGVVPFLMDDERMIALMSEGWSELKREKLDVQIKLSYGNFCVLKPTAMTVSSATPLDDLHMIFTMMRCDHCYVCEQGALVGVVTTQTLLHVGPLAKTVK